MANELAVVQPTKSDLSIQEMVILSNHLAQSGFFEDSRTADKALVKIMAGRELGFGPMASMSGIHVIEGKPSIGAHLLAAAIKRSGKYDFKILKADKEICELVFLESRDGKKWEVCGPNIEIKYADCTDLWTAHDKQGKPYVKRNWRVHPDDMLFARAISKGYRRYCADLSGGMLVYVNDEMDNSDEQQAGQQPAPEQITPSNGMPVEPAPESAPEVQRISDHQASELSDLIRETGYPWEQFAAAYGIRGIRQLPVTHYLDAKAMLSAYKKPSTPAAADQSMPPGTAPAVDVIDQQQWNFLLVHLKDKPEYAKKLLAVLGLERYSKIPRYWYPLVVKLATANYDLDAWRQKYLGQLAASDVLVKAFDVDAVLKMMEGQP